MRRWLSLLAIAVGGAACAGILGFRTSGPRLFEHREHVLEGIACTECHAGIARAGDTGPIHLPDRDTCVRCHQKPHDDRECTTCHGMPFTAMTAIQRRQHMRFSHARHQEPVRGNCMRCHGGIAGGDAAIRPTLGSCVGCHEHRDRFEVRDCAACHVDLPEDLRPPESHMIHPDPFLASHGAAAASAGDLCGGCHKESFCASCHGVTTPALPTTLAFDDPFEAGMHRAGFRARHAEASRAEPGLCSTCHTEQSCRGCHDRELVSAPSGETRRTPHPPGWVGVTSNEHGRAARRDPAACASCHGGAGEALCVGCHRVGGVGGNPHPPGWSSDRSERQLPCRACHVGG